MIKYNWRIKLQPKCSWRSKTQNLCFQAKVPMELYNKSDNYCSWQVFSLKCNDKYCLDSALDLLPARLDVCLNFAQVSKEWGEITTIYIQTKESACGQPDISLVFNFPPVSLRHNALSLCDFTQQIYLASSRDYHLNIKARCPEADSN